MTWLVEKALVGSEDWVIKSINEDKETADRDARQTRAYFRSHNYRLRVREG